MLLRYSGLVAASRFSRNHSRSSSFISRSAVTSSSRETLTFTTGSLLLAIMHLRFFGIIIPSHGKTAAGRSLRIYWACIQIGRKRSYGRRMGRWLLLTLLFAACPGAGPPQPAPAAGGLRAIEPV